MAEASSGKFRRIWLLPGALVVLGIAIVASAVIWTQSDGQSSSASSGSGCSAVDVADQVMRSVVTIHVSDGAGNPAGTGSGEFLTKNGELMTNNHVIAPAAKGGSVSVQLLTGEQVPAQIVGRDPQTDLAVLKIDKNGTPAIPLATESAVRVDEQVFAVGAPLGLSDTMTAGIVSGLNRTIRVPSDGDTTALLVAAIQTDASINPGNSGGALVDCAGELVGVPTAGATAPDSSGAPVAGSIGLGFAIPASTADAITQELIENGEIVHGYLGIGVAPARASDGSIGGLYVTVLAQGGPAREAGLRQGDVITKIDGEAADSADQLQAATLTRRPGEKVKLTYERGGETRIARVTLGEQPRQPG